MDSSSASAAPAPEAPWSITRKAITGKPAAVPLWSHREGSLANDIMRCLMEHHRDTRDAAEREEWIIQLLRHKIRTALHRPDPPIEDNTITIQLTAGEQDGKTLERREDADLRRRLELVPTDPIDVELEVEYYAVAAIATITLRLRLML